MIALAFFLLSEMNLVNTVLLTALQRLLLLDPIPRGISFPSTDLARLRNRLHEFTLLLAKRSTDYESHMREN